MRARTAELLAQLVRERPSSMTALARILGLTPPPTSSSAPHGWTPGGDIVRVDASPELLVPIPTEPGEHLGDWRVVVTMTQADVVAAIGSSDRSAWATHVDGVFASPPFYVETSADGAVLEWNPKRDLARERQGRLLGSMFRRLASVEDVARVAAVARDHGWSAEDEADAVVLVPPATITRLEVGLAVMTLAYEEGGIDGYRSAPRLSAKDVGGAWELRTDEGAPLQRGSWEVRIVLAGDPEREIPCDGRPDIGPVVRMIVRRA